MQGDPDRQSVVVPFSDDEVVRDEELITDEDKPGASPEERKTRRERRQARLQSKLQEGAEAKEELEAERRQTAELRERLARLEGMVAAGQQPRQAPDGKDEFEAELDAIYKKQSDAYTAAQAEVKAGTFTPERQQHYERIARDIETSKADVHMRRTLARTEPIRQQNQAQQVWVQKYPEVYQNQRAFQYAQARAQQRLSLGENITPEVVDEIMTETKTQFRLGAKPAPTQSERAKFAGTPASGSGGGSAPSGIALTKELRQMALAAYDDLPEDEAIKKWTNKTGKRLRERKVL
jgi:hypothetical protein